MKVALDTNAYTALMRGHEVVAGRVRRSSGVIVSVVVVGELLYGFRAGSRFRENGEQLDRFLEAPHVELREATRDTADRFGRIALGLRKKGRPIPTNDIWIAAHAMETGAELVSSDGHFEAVDGLAWLRFSA